MLRAIGIIFKAAAICIGTLIGLFILLAVIGGSSSKSPTVATEPNPVFKVGDVVDIDEAGVYHNDKEWPGAVMCYGSDAPNDLRETVVTMRDTRMWPSSSQLKCERLDYTYAYEVMKVAEGPAPYDHVYCVNDVVDFPTNKSGCVWATFPVGHARLSACKAGPDWVGDKSDRPKETGINVGPLPSHVMPCQNFKKEQKPH